MKIHQEFGQLRKLRFLWMTGANLIGEIPESFTNLSSLQHLDLARNNLEGPIPTRLFSLKNLTDIYLFDNKLSGEIPQSIEALNLVGIDLSVNNLTGTVPEDFGKLQYLYLLDLFSNQLTGELPSELARNISWLGISDNKFSGEIPQGVGAWSNLLVLKASNNFFSGKIPKEITNADLVMLFLDGNNFSGELPSEIISCKLLFTLNVSNNKLSGEIPAAIGSLPYLVNLDLSENRFSGEIPPEIGNLKLISLNLSSNQLVGRIPNRLDKFAYSFMNNAGLCVDDHILNFPNCNSKLHKSKMLSSEFLAWILFIFVSLVILLLTLFLVKGYKRKNPAQHQPTWKLTSFQRLDFTVENIVSNLTENNLIGSGGSGKVYRIVINQESGQSVAVKKIWNSKKLDHKLEKEFVAEVETLSNIRHSNIVKLMCCISSDESKLLVYEHMEKQSLDRWLHGNKRRSLSGMSSVNPVVLDWPTRLRIAIGAAQGLCYLYHECHIPIIHRDVKSSNILLDSEFKAKIADFGLAKMLSRHASCHTMSAVAGSFGYLAPEYAYTTKVNAKVDVYSFGVVLLELVTGREANGVDENMNLAQWAWQYFSEDKPIVEILDPAMKEPSYLEVMIMVYKVGIVCTRSAPSTRPSLKEVLHVLRRCCAAIERF